jgi:cysteinyl-tRNA synthetase
MLQALGLNLPAEAEEVEIPAEIMALAEARWQAKLAKDWPAADVARKALDAAGWIIKDSKDSYQVVKK